jgi:hypothetical protein
MATWPTAARRRSNSGELALRGKAAMATLRTSWIGMRELGEDMSMAGR